MFGDMNQSLGSGWRGTEARHHATRKGFEHAPIFKSSSEGSVGKKKHPAFMGFKFSEGCLGGSQSSRKVRAYTISQLRWTSTYQADQNEKNKCYFSKNSSARDVSIACGQVCGEKLLRTDPLTYSGHGDHEKIDTVPVCETSHPVFLVIIRKIGRVAAIFKLQTKTREWTES